MTVTSKNRKSLRQLDTAELRSVAGGFVIYGSTAVGNPEESTSFTGGVSYYLPAVQR